tara:strand:- start:394 stop:906 length:513 start_codon:yes stop_codon:yes gene_type:complete
MGQEFFINSQELEDKIRTLLPSQGGAGAGFDLSASTQIVPIIDLTESAEGSNVRQDLQTALSHNSITTFSVTNASNTVLVNSTGYFRVFGMITLKNASSVNINLFDGSTSKNVFEIVPVATAEFQATPFDFVVFIGAGDSLRATSDNTNSLLTGNTRQIADIDGNLVNPL